MPASGYLHTLKFCDTEIDLQPFLCTAIKPNGTPLAAREIPKRQGATTLRLSPCTMNEVRPQTSARPMVVTYYSTP